MDNYEPTPFIIKISKPFRFLLESDFIFIVSIIIFVSLGIIGIYNLNDILLIMLFLSIPLSMISGITTAIFTIYIFSKTIKQKSLTLQAYNIFSRYILIAAFASLLFMLIVYGTINFINYRLTTTDDNIISIITTAIFSIINISGFIHLALLYRKYAKYIDSIQPKS